MPLDAAPQQPQPKRQTPEEIFATVNALLNLVEPLERTGMIAALLCSMMPRLSKPCRVVIVEKLSRHL